MGSVRDTNALRVPLKITSQTPTNLTISEENFKIKPTHDEIFPQTLKISSTDTNPIEISPIYDGFMYFIANVPSSYSSREEYLNSVIPELDEIIRRNFPSDWPIKGSIILQFSSDAIQILKNKFPFINPTPSIIRYEPIILTEEFLFTTLQYTPKFKLIYHDMIVDQTMSDWFPTLIWAFLQGFAGVYFSTRINEVSNVDVANFPMPKVDTSVSSNELRVVLASKHHIVEDSSIPTENTSFGYLTEIPGTYFEQVDVSTNPKHPSFSVISLMAFYQNIMKVNENFFVSEDKTSPFMDFINSPSTSIYRKIKLTRKQVHPDQGTPAVGRDLKVSFEFANFALAWQKSGGEKFFQRFPIGGNLYLPLDNSQYTFWLPSIDSPSPGTIGDTNSMKFYENNTTEYFKVRDIDSTIDTISFNVLSPGYQIIKTKDWKNNEAQTDRDLVSRLTEFANYLLTKNLVYQDIVFYQGKRQPAEAHLKSTAFNIFENRISIQDVKDRLAPSTNGDYVDNDENIWYKTSWEGSEPDVEAKFRANARAICTTKTLEGYTSNSDSRKPNNTGVGVSLHISGDAADVNIYWSDDDQNVMRGEFVNALAGWSQKAMNLVKYFGLERPLPPRFNSSGVWNNISATEPWHFKLKAGWTRPNPFDPDNAPNEPRPFP